MLGLHTYQKTTQYSRLHCFLVGHGIKRARKVNIWPKIPFFGQNLAIFTKQANIWSKTTKDANFGPKILICGEGTKHYKSKNRSLPKIGPRRYILANPMFCKGNPIFANRGSIRAPRVREILLQKVSKLFTFFHP